ncbi:YND1 [Candida jiufengensis]|uniref:YND1 n=1 Tax=Candida jiufengensis TaxID=497108 RepID=UPI0022242BE3|nr:YND1 [Candida jiufengensis]KAI5949903.1 YND1 [Candida jiufengensis]
MSDIDSRSNSNYKDDKFGIVIDSGSSGSRIQIYKWIDPKTQLKSSDLEILKSPPKITQEKEWTKKISPGISTYNTNKKIKQIWSNHYSELMRFAEKIIPVEKHSETPVFVLSTAGMRLLPKNTQSKILSETCSSIRENTNFLLPNCDDFVQIIDGSTEGIYGWLGLNYLMGQFKNYDTKQANHESIGFMDMGGASTQIAFVPSSEEQIKKHNNDLSKVLLRNIDGQTQTWDVFVATWLGFGANEARKRFIQQLINLALVNQEELQGHLNDPCLPKGATLDYDYEGKTYKINGVGNYEMCIKSIYPLLMKSIPCDDEPCLFNGIHGPKLDFEKDKFVGISEYWYTANDIFHSGGEYDYKGFNIKVKEYCESKWDDILKNSNGGDYSGLDPDKFLKDACFKASWVMNILHEGFELPRIGFELNSDKEQDKDSQDVTNKHVPFKSADSVEGEELSWTLGKILLFASSQIDPTDKQPLDIGIYPSEISGKSFVPGGVINNKSHLSEDDSDDERDGELGHFIYSITFFFLLAFFIYSFGSRHFGRWKGKLKRIHVPIEIRRRANVVVSKIPGLEKFANNFAIYQQLEQDYNLEEGVGASPSVESSPKQATGDASVLRTRSAIGLDQGYDDSSSGGSNGKSKHFNPRVNNFINKPFVVPKKNSFYQFSENNSRESLSRSVSNSSLARSKMP